jgi:hypothetical protein
MSDFIFAASDVVEAEVGTITEWTNWENGLRRISLGSGAIVIAIAPIGKNMHCLADWLTTPFNASTAWPLCGKTEFIKVILVNLFEAGSVCLGISQCQVIIDIFLR